jgi:hypothetical protein
VAVRRGGIGVSLARVSKRDAQKVAAIISDDKVTTQTYCDIQELGEQMERAYEKRDIKLVDELFQKIDTLKKPSVPNMRRCSMGFRTSRKTTSSVRSLCRQSQRLTGCVRGRPRKPGSRSKIRKRQQPRGH